ncbi:MAG TPA: glycoside hydrolase family 140 protein [Coleofasciculaceae cyanobacterium]|jgi:hypothetical protein
MPSETPRQGLSVDFSHGALNVSDNKRYLVHQDGTAFFYLGCTAWELFHRLNREEADLYLENRRQKGFTVIQAVVLAELDGLDTPNPYGHKPLINNDPTTPNEDYFKHVDYIVDKAQEKGIYIGMVATWGDKVGPKLWGQGPEQLINTTNARIFGEFLGNRYKNFPNIIWILGGDRPGKGYESVWREMVKGIKAGDQGCHLVTYHTLGGTSSSIWFHQEEWLDFNMLQSGHSDRDLPNYDFVYRDYKKSPPKPTLDGEPRYEDHAVNWQPKNGYFDDYDVRQAAYWGVFAGGLGTTYGAHPIWQMYAPGRSPITHVRTYWYDSLDFEGAWDMMHLRHLMESRPFLTGVPAQSLITNCKGRGADHVRATQGDGYGFVYLPTGKKVTVRLEKISGNPVKSWWFNPRTGEALLIGTFPNSRTREFVPPGESGRGNDWVLVLDDAAKNFPPPGLAT